MLHSSHLVVNLESIDKNDAAFVGETAARLGDMLQGSLPVPAGFVLTPSSYLSFLKENRLDIKIKHLLGTINFNDPTSVSQVSKHIKKQIVETPVPQRIVKEVFKEYEKLGGKVMLYSPDSVSESSFVATGESVLIEKIRDLWTHAFSAKDLYQRFTNEHNLIPDSVSILVQKDVSTELFGTLLTTDPVTAEKGKIVTKHKLSEAQKENLVKLAKSVEKHFYFPQQVKWAIDHGQAYILSSAPIVVSEVEVEEETVISETNSPLLIGHPVSSGIGIGEVIKINSEKDLSKIKDSMVLVLKKFEKKYLPHFKKAKAVIIEDGNKSEIRGLGLPTVSGATSAFNNLKDGMTVTVNGKSGEVHRGSGIAEQTTSASFSKTATKLYVSYDTLENSKRVLDEVEGVGMFSSEEFFAKHPHPKKIHSDGKKEELINKLAEEIASVATDIYPRPLIYKVSNTLSHEYERTTGGKQYEEKELNPLLGFHGALRHIHDKETLSIELLAVKKVREKLGMTNVRLLLSFVRTIKEAEALIKEIHAVGLKQSHTFKIFLSVDLPANAILVNDFIDAGLDGVWVNTDSLATLTLGVDPENPEVKRSVDENNKAVLWLYHRTLQAAREQNVCAGAYGSAISESTDLVEELVFSGVEILAVTPSALSKTKKAVIAAEKKIIQNLTA